MKQEGIQLIAIEPWPGSVSVPLIRGPSHKRDRNIGFAYVLETPKILPMASSV